MKYKNGDTIRVKSLEWYNENKDSNGDVHDKIIFTSYMSKYCGKEMTIEEVNEEEQFYHLYEDNEAYKWTDEMFEGDAEETTLQGEFGLLENKINGILFSNKNYADKVELCLGDDYEIVVENGRTFVQKKKPKYPKTFIEVLNFWHPDRQIEDDYQKYYKKDLIEKFQNLLYARDAYWKIADNWKPDYKNSDIDLYVIINIYNQVEKAKYGYGFQHCVLSFPTEEMRDAFFENFKDLIEDCKEFL